MMNISEVERSQNTTNCVVMLFVLEYPISEVCNGSTVWLNAEGGWWFFQIYLPAVWAVFVA
jgi:hypothetical protein